MNIIEILKKVPLGTKLYSPICGECIFENVISNTLFSVVAEGIKYYFLEDGRYKLEGECCIFPSKDEKDWNKFQIFNNYKPGDIIYFVSKSNRKYINILQDIKNNDLHNYVNLLINNNNNILLVNVYFDIDNIKEIGFATKEEKEILFKEIENNGYKWNEETKTLVKLIKDKFDITTLKPFDKVLVRDCNTHVWKIDLFNSKGTYYFLTITGCYEQCIPFEANKHLLDTVEKCDDYYINW